MKTRTKYSSVAFGLAVCSTPLSSAADFFQLFPAGEFRARDGRPEGIKAWKMDAAIAQRLIAAAATRKTPYVIDYDHQTLSARESGNPAPAAGWFSQLEWREGGLYVVAAGWNARAKAMIDADEYRFISPVFRYNEKGEVTELLMVSITNVPALDGMDEILAAASQRFITQPPEPEENVMNPILAALYALLGLADDADQAAATAALSQVIEKAKGVDDLNTQVAALTQRLEAAGEPDPSKYVSVTVVEDLKTQMATLSQGITSDKVTALVQQGLDDKKLLPAQKDWATKLGNQDIASLTTYLDNAQPIAALTGSQTNGEGAGNNEGALTDDELAVCNLLGQTPDDFKAAKTA